MLLRNFAVATLLTLLSTSGHAKANRSSCNGVSLPNSVGSVLQKQYPEWKLAKSIDLRRDDRKIWEASHPNQCPSVVIGNFERNDKISYAVAMFKVSPQLQQILIVVTPTTLGEVKIHILSPAQVVPYLSVVLLQSPGSYRDVEGTLFKLPNDSVLYQSIEAGTLVYYYANGQYENFLSDE